MQPMKKKNEVKSSSVVSSDTTPKKVKNSVAFNLPVMSSIYPLFVVMLLGDYGKYHFVKQYDDRSVCKRLSHYEVDYVALSEKDIPRKSAICKHCMKGVNIAL